MKPLAVNGEDDGSAQADESRQMQHGNRETTLKFAAYTLAD